MNSDKTKWEPVASVALQPFGQSNSPVSPRARRKKVLLADDDPGIRETLSRVLESEQYDVVLAVDGDAAAAATVEQMPDLILLDLNMPGRDGWSAFRFIKAARLTIPVIVITARPDQFGKAAELGVDALMEKPLNLPVLLDAMQTLLAGNGCRFSLGKADSEKSNEGSHRKGWVD